MSNYEEVPNGLTFRALAEQKAFRKHGAIPPTSSLEFFEGTRGCLQFGNGNSIASLVEIAKERGQPLSEFCAYRKVCRRASQCVEKDFS